MRGPGLLARLRAERGGCLFIDVIDGRPVLEWTTRDGRSFMGQSRWGLWVERYTVLYNKHGVPYRAGPRVAGAHRRVFDHWEVGPTTIRTPGLATCRCEDCGAEWPEGAAGPEYPIECRSDG